MKPSRRMVLTFVVAWALALAREPEEIRVSLQAISLGDTQIEGLLFFNGREMQTLHAPSSHFHRPVAYAGPNPLTLFVEREEGDADESPYRPVGRIPLPRGVADVVLLLTQREGQTRGQAIPLHEQEFPVGSLMMTNLSGREVQMRFGDDLFNLMNGRTRVIRPSLQERGVVPLLYRFMDDTDNASLVSSGWFYNPERRYFVFIFDQEGQLAMRSVTWFITPGEEDS